MIVQDFIESYVKGTLGKKTVCGCWSIINWGNMDVLQYTPSDLTDIHERIAYRLQDGSVLSNANRLEYVGRRFAWGSEISNRRVDVEEQHWLENAGAVPLPFTLFDEVPEMDVRDFEWILKPTAERIKEIIPSAYKGDQPRERIRHFSGACLFAIGKDTYLFDIDRQEIHQHGIFNAFLTKLPKKVSTIQEAYDVLMPDGVREANEKGIEVKRQGEFFFIKYSDECPIKPDLTDEEMHVLRHPPPVLGLVLHQSPGEECHLYQMTGHHLEMLMVVENPLYWILRRSGHFRKRRLNINVCWQNMRVLLPSRALLGNLQPDRMGLKSILKLVKMSLHPALSSRTGDNMVTWFCMGGTKWLRIPGRSHGRLPGILIEVNNANM